MRRIWSVIGFLCAVCSCTVLTADEEIQFNRDIRPILADNCFSCHGPDAGNRKADFRLDVRDDAVSMKAFVPGNPETSTAISRILSSDDATRMPPPESHRELTRAQTLLLERWVRDGAIYQKHWAYETPVRPDVPADRHAVDYLIEQRLKQRAITAAPEADRRTLIRRVFLDLTGMPPTSEQVRAFQNDQSPQAWNTVIEQCLSSPHFGERMAVDWLDVVRFADTIGYHSDVPRNVWPYRDWVIRSFNENKPFDRFTREQIAGDLLPDADQESRIGSAFNRLVQSTEEGGAQPKDYESRMLADRVRAIGTVWLGQTTGCAQCHDHKFDPFTIRDFYSLGAFFADIDERPVGARGPGMPVADTQQQAILTRLQTRVQETQTASDATVRSAAETELKDFLATLPHCLVTSRTTQPRTVRMLPRGNWMDESGEVMRAAVPHYLPQPAIEEREPDRRDLADWLVSPNNPLTARTVMNRLWKQFLGTALSRNPADLGTQGEMPTNPELLDWLATEFVQGGWNVKQMIRIIVTSEAYRRSSITTPEHLQADPENR
ncbi:MAG: PSD1 and planctomycete cytochrome C domain-containing protein, partial [Planctomyces sp.]